MPKSILNYFAHFLSDWSLDDEVMPALLSMMPRSTGPDSWRIGWAKSMDGEPMLLVGESFQDLSPQGQRAYAHLVLNELLLGHLDADFAWNNNQAVLFTYLWQAFLCLPRDLQTYWPHWHTLTTINQGIIDRALLLKTVQDKALVDDYPEVLILANALQSHLSFKRDDHFTLKNHRQRWSDQLAPQSGQLPVNLERFLQSEPSLKSTISWSLILRNHLKRFLKTRLQTTTKRTSKRYGTIPGLRVKGHAKIGLAIDTSGSVSTTTLSLFKNEIKKIADLGHSIEVVEADIRIQRRYSFRGNLPDQLMGGGGTNYDPAIRYFEEKSKADLLIYLTDGRGPRPLKWKSTPLIWLIHLAESQPTYLKAHHSDWPGKKVYLEIPAF